MWHTVVLRAHTAGEFPQSISLGRNQRKQAWCELLGQFHEEMVVVLCVAIAPAGSLYGGRNEVGGSDPHPQTLARLPASGTHFPVSTGRS